MKTRTGILLGCLSVILILVGAFVVGMLVGGGSGRVSVSSGTWLVLNLGGEVPDYSEIRMSDFWGNMNPSTDDLCRDIRRAAGDKKIEGIILRPSALQINLANLDEINAALKDFRAAKKPIIAHGEVLAQKDYLLCSMADKVYLDPAASGGLILEGVSANMMFYKEALNKLGIKMHVMQSGAYKGAGEPYTQTKLSPGTEENLRKVLKNRYDLIISDIASARKLDTLAVRNVFETRPDLIIPAAEAKKYGLIDQVSTYDALLTEYKIGRKKCLSIKDYRSHDAAITTGDKIAVLNLTGTIAPSQGFYSEGTISANKVDDFIQAVEDDGNIKAVVLRVNSPGGSATESELIYQKLKSLEIPIVVSMGGIAASGGYYISCAGDYIFADAHTITGSIGVIMALPEATGLGEKLGLDSQTISYGKFSGFGSIFEPYDQELLNSLQRNSDNVYTEFKQRVMDGRKISADAIGTVAEGRVFGANDAKVLKLVDEIGGLDAAIKKAAELAKTSDYSVQNFPRKISVFDMFLKSGMFRMASQALTGKKLTVDERMQAYLEQTFPTKQWLYVCPFKLD